MSRWFSFFKKGFQRTSNKLASVWSGKRIDQDTLDEIEETLFAADFGVETTEAIVEAIDEAYRKNKDLQQKEGADIGKSILLERLDGSEGKLGENANKPEVICVVGVNGSGKTTSAAKLAKMLKDQGNSVLVAACDTFRAAANQQLQIWCERLDVPLIASHQGADAAAVAYDAYEAAKKRDADYLILDTAGRLHTKSNLMEELAKIERVIKKHDSSAPHHKWIVVDGSIGTNSIQQAKVFNEVFPLTGVIVTKLDGTSKGGAIVAIYQELGLPVYFVGLGEKPEDLREFDVEDYTDAIFGINGS
ncbi:MAG: signal recognition particle-docking protein FtsY [Opitutales bacterium]|nr:signal recognition particle-docking protein FtsY [Opitutales bacterium]